MDLQFVFGNPVRRKKSKSLAKHKNSSKINRKEGKFVKIKAVRKRNPVHYKFTKPGKKNRYSKQFMSPGEVGEVKEVLRKWKALYSSAVKEGKPLTKITKKINQYNAFLAKSQQRMAEARDQKRGMTSEGWKAETVIKKIGPKHAIPTKVSAKKPEEKKILSKEEKKKLKAKALKRKPSKKKISKKKKVIKKKRKVTKRSKPMAKKRKVIKRKKISKKKRSAIARKAARARWGTKKKTAKKKVVRRKKAAPKKRKSVKKRVAAKKRKSTKKRKVRRMRTVATGKVKRGGKTYRIRTQMNPKRRNPMKMMDMFKPKNLFSDKGYGWTGLEGLGLFGGGALYGQVNKFASKVPYVRETLEKIPVVGPVIAPAMPILIVGTILNIMGKKQKIKAMEVIGRGLVGSAVVGIGVNAGEQIPGLKSTEAVAGYSNQLGTLPAPQQLGQYKESAADFGGVDYTPDMKGADNQMGGVDFSPESEADFGGVDYTSDGDADFGEVPEGLC